MENLQGLKALVTGGSKGLGKATAIALAKEGVNVAITGRDKQALITTAKELESYNVQVTYAVFDVGNYNAVQEGIKSIIAVFNTLDILINNAGIAAFGCLNDMNVTAWSQIIQTNLMGMYYVTKEVLPYLIEKNSGDIINISSTAGLNGNANTSAYSASKFAVIGMSQSLMKEVRQNNIRVCTLTPSTIATDMATNLGITDGNTETVLQPEDFAALIISGLKLPRRAMLTTASLWSTNP